PAGAGGAGGAAARHPRRRCLAQPRPPPLADIERNGTDHAPQLCALTKAGDSIFSIMRIVRIFTPLQSSRLTMQRSIRGDLSAAAAVALLTGAAGQAAAQEVNIYSARHYQTDEALYEGFTEKTGIRINRIEGEGDALMERIKAEGKNSPADVLITVDAGRLWRADQLDLFQPVRSKLLEERIPANLPHPDGRWFGFSTRARVIFYNKEMVDPSEIGSYEDLADPKWEGMVCMRSSSNI